LNSRQTLVMLTYGRSWLKLKITLNASAWHGVGQLESSLVYLGALVWKFEMIKRLLRFWIPAKLCNVNLWVILAEFENCAKCFGVIWRIISRNFVNATLYCTRSEKDTDSAKLLARSHKQWAYCKFGMLHEHRILVKSAEALYCNPALSTLWPLRLLTLDA